MTVASISTQCFEKLRKFVEKETAISLADDKVYLLETRLREIMREQGINDFPELYAALQSSVNKTLKERVLDAMTTNETLWFRDTQPFDAFSDFLLPAYSAEIQQGKRRKIRIWSAACSTGQEPYSLVMTFLEAARKNSNLNLNQLEILATDYSDKALAKAKAGVYGGMAMSRGLPEGYQEKYFTPVGEQFEVKREIKDRVVFRKFNLQDSFVMQGSFDIILTRYVLIYFTDDFKREVLRKVHGALEPRGVLFLGSSESLPEHTAGYTLVRSGRATYYQKVDAALPLTPARPQTVEPPKATEPATAPRVPAGPVGSSSPVKPILPISQSRSKPGSHTEGLKKATEDLAEIVKRLQDLNARHGVKKD